MFVVVLSSVAIVCHSTKAIMRRILFHAQDRNMTNGDYAFFTFSSLYSAASTEKPWQLYDMENDDRERRLKAFYSLKQVRGVSLHSISKTGTKPATKKTTATKSENRQTRVDTAMYAIV